MIKNRLAWGVVALGAFTESGWDELMAGFVFKKDAAEYLREKLPRARDRRDFEIRRLAPGDFSAATTEGDGHGL